MKLEPREAFPVPLSDGSLCLYELIAIVWHGANHFISDVRLAESTESMWVRYDGLDSRRGGKGVGVVLTQPPNGRTFSWGGREYHIAAAAYCAAALPNPVASAVTFVPFVWEQLLQATSFVRASRASPKLIFTENDSICEHNCYTPT